MKNLLFAFALISALVVGLSGCGGGNPLPVNGACATTSCANSQICKAGGPDIIFGAAEVGLAVALGEAPAIKKPLHDAYANLLITFQQPNLTWQQVGAAMTAQIIPVAGRWAPAIQVVIQRLSGYANIGPVDLCDQQFLVQHVQNVVTMTTTYTW